MTEFMQLVKRMREAQRGYFKMRNSAMLHESDLLERGADAAIEREESGQPDLFKG